jgi:hypothetical protein
MFAWHLRRQLNVQSVFVLRPPQRLWVPHQRNVRNRCAWNWRNRGEGADRYFTLRARQHNCIQRVPFGGEANILTGKRLAMGVSKFAAWDLGRTFTENVPRARAINCLAIDVKSLADFQQNILLCFGNRSVWTGSDIQQERAVLADDIHQIIHKCIYTAIVLTLNIPP